MESGGFTALHQLTLQGIQDHIKPWDINDPIANLKVINKKLGKLIAMDCQPVCCRRCRFFTICWCIEPRHKVPSRKYVTETVLRKIEMGIKAELMKKLHATGIEYHSFILQMGGVRMLLHIPC